jgi:hypothetical protein
MVTKEQKRQIRMVRNEVFENLSVISTRTKSGQDRLIKILLGDSQMNSVPKTILDYIMARDSAGQFICKSVVIEDKYIDKDHSSALSSYYARSFRQISKVCQRLHFFSNRIVLSDLLNAEKLENTYLGFCVLRPLPYRRIGRTALKRIQHDPFTEFPTCHGDITVNLAGTKLHVDAPLFMEQDTMVAACASVAVWSSTATLANRFYGQESTTSDITNYATKYLVKGRPMPSDGLHYDQMMEAIRSVGYSPVIYGIQDSETTKHMVYGYIESEVPPILLCRLADGGDHAIVGVGHGYQYPVESPELIPVGFQDEPILYYARSSQWVSNILVNDDQRGPYRSVNFLDIDRQSLLQRIQGNYENIDIDELNENIRNWQSPVAIDMNMPNINIMDEGEDIANIWAVIVPFPKGVMLKLEEAELKSARILRYWHIMNNLPIPDDIVLRTYLIRSNEYKNRLVTKDDLDPFVKALYQAKPMPRWIWVTEIHSKDSYNNRDPLDWLISGEILLDATSTEWTPDFVAFHYISDEGTLVVHMKPEHEDAQEAIITGSWITPSTNKYRGWVRSID